MDLESVIDICGTLSQLEEVITRERGILISHLMGRECSSCDPLRSGCPAVVAAAHALDEIATRTLDLVDPTHPDLTDPDEPEADPTEADPTPPDAPEPSSPTSQPE